MVTFYAIVDYVDRCLRDSAPVVFTELKTFNEAHIETKLEEQKLNLLLELLL